LGDVDKYIFQTLTNFFINYSILIGLRKCMVETNYLLLQIFLQLYNALHKHVFFNAIIPFALLYNIKPFLACVLAFDIKIGLA